MPFFPDPAPPFDYIRDFTPDHPSSIVAEWQRHVDAGRIGDTPPMSAEVRASILAAEAIFCRPRGIW